MEACQAEPKLEKKFVSNVTLDILWNSKKVRSSELISLKKVYLAMLPKILDNAHITEDQPRAKQGKYEIKFNWFRHRGYKIIIDHNSIVMVTYSPQFLLIHALKL